MLERIICWDRECAFSAEKRTGTEVLSSVPKVETINVKNAKYLVKQFRKAMRTLHPDDWRRSWGELEESKLIDLLHYTFLLSRPVLAWELDLDQV